MKLTVIFLSFFIAVSGISKAQQKKESQYSALGQMAFSNGDYKVAITNLEKAVQTEGNNPDILYLLGYSYLQTAAYTNAINAFTKVISLRPQKPDAYYYRGKARNTQGTQMNSPLSPIEREKLLKAGINDFTKGIELKKEQAIEYYQNRAIAYRDYAILKEQKIPGFYDKTVAENAYKSSLSDLQHILNAFPNRKDISDEMKKVRVYMANLGNK
jgi:tetratricopeptide (TPR) repeat protein